MKTGIHTLAIGLMTSETVKELFNFKMIKGLRAIKGCGRMIKSMGKDIRST
jgi:hypothetical protein